MVKKKFTSLLAAIMLLMTAFGASQAAASESALSDVDGHWAESQIEAWVEQGFVKGYEDGSFKPDEGISRAQFFALINRAFGLINKTDVSYSDVNASAWYVADVQKAVEAGYASGVSESIMKPNEVVSREQAASMIARLLEVEANADAIAQFKDADSIASWSKGAVGALAAKGYMNGHTNGNFGPSDKLSRAQAVTLLNKLGTYYSQAGSFDEETIEGNVIVSAADVKIKGAVIKGDLIVTEGVAEGDVYFEDVTVKGNTIIKGGGVKSVFFINSTLNDLSVGKKYTPVRVVLSGSSTAGAAEVTGGAILEEENASAGGFGDVAVGEDSDVTLRGSFADVTVEGSGASVTTESGTSVQSLTVEEDAEDATVNVENNSNVSQLTLNSPTIVTGQGTIQTANVNAEGSTIEQRPINIILADGVTVTAAGQEVTNSTSNVGGYYPTPVQTVANVTNEVELENALKNVNIKTIKLMNSIDTTKPLLIERKVTIEGDFHVITLEGGTDGNDSVQGLGIMADGVVLKRLIVSTIRYGTPGTGEVLSYATGDNLIEIYADAVLDNVFASSGNKAGIYVNNNKPDRHINVLFRDIRTNDNRWKAGIGLQVQHNDSTITATFEGDNLFEEEVAVYYEGLENDDRYIIEGLDEEKGFSSRFFSKADQQNKKDQFKWTQDKYVVSSTNGLMGALATRNGKLIEIANDITLYFSEELASNTKIDGAGHTLTINTSGDGDHDLQGLGLMGDNITISNLTVVGTHGDNLIEIYGDKATLENVTVENSKKAGIYVNNDNMGEWSVTFKDITTNNNNWAGIGLRAKDDAKITVNFIGNNNFSEDIAVYTEGKFTTNKYNVMGLNGVYTSTDHPEGKDQTVWVKVDSDSIDNGEETGDFDSEITDGSDN